MTNKPSLVLSLAVTAIALALGLAISGIIIFRARSAKPAKGADTRATPLTSGQM